MKTNNNITREELLKRFSYNPSTGELSSKNWRPNIKARVLTAKRNGYIYVRINKVAFSAHRIIWVLHHGSWPSIMIDHINGDKTDNRIANLREASDYENQYNAKKQIRNKSGFKGISFRPSTNRWRAAIRQGGRVVYEKTFLHLKDAVIHIQSKRKELHNEFARNL